ncbi:MAG: PAS domain S-box protein, partial [Bacteroidia bacterium]|nr:PAS domain S-box protein [Bacteroidia bacterium]
MLDPLEDVLSRSTDWEERQNLEMIYRNGLRLKKLVNTLLDFSRIEAGRIQANYTPTDLAAYTIDLASNFRSAVEKAGMKLIVTTHPLSEKIYVDQDMWEKIILNLLSNAFKFTFQGEIEVSLTENENHVTLTVRDTGEGIPAADLPYIFDRFRRVEGAKSRTFEGSGIGLSLVQELIRLHGGTIGVVSTLSQGTTFTVEIPKGTQHLPANQVQTESPISSTTTDAKAYLEEVSQWVSSNGNVSKDHKASLDDPPLEPWMNEKPRLILAEDNADMRAYLIKLLSPKYRVEAVPDGRQALQRVLETPPDLLLTDVMMPELDGFALLKKLRQNPATRTLPVIMLSARAGEEATQEGLDAGATDYLVKPFSAKELLSRVGTHIRTAYIHKESENYFQSIADNTPVMTWITRPDAYCTYLNKQWYDYTGQTPEMGLGFGWLSAVHPDDAERSGATFLDANQKQIPFSLEYRLRAKNGAYRWHLDSGLPKFDDQGNFEGFIGSVIEIHERKIAEESLQESEERFRSIFAYTNIGAAIKELDGNFTYVNPAYEILTGYTQEELFELNFYALIHPEDYEENVQL